MKYSIILADPPWHFRVWREAGQGRTAASHYPVMRLEDIAALPVQQLADKDCTLFLWATWPNLPEALKVIEAWGFTYKTVAFVWIKQLRSGFGLHMGLGYWTRANTEIVLLATRATLSASTRRCARRCLLLCVSIVASLTRSSTRSWNLWALCRALNYSHAARLKVGTRGAMRLSATWSCQHEPTPPRPALTAGPLVSASSPPLSLSPLAYAWAGLLQTVRYG